MTGAQTSSDTYRLLRQLGSRVDSTHAAMRGHELVVVQRFHRAAPETEATHRLAQSFAKNGHPNVARVQNVDVVGDELIVASEFVDGVTLGDLLVAAASKRVSDQGPVLPPPTLLRIVLDVLGGLQSVHSIRNAANESHGAFHGAVCPTNVVVGKDGVARLILAFRPRPLEIEASSEALGYAAPEVLEDGLTAGVRSDLYACGVMLWEGLQGKRLFTETQPREIFHRQRDDEVPWLAPPASIIARLGAVVLRALAFDPVMRFRTAVELERHFDALQGRRSPRAA